MKRYIIKKIKDVEKNSISISSDKINTKITGMYKRMNNIMDKVNISGKENDVKIGIEKLQNLYNEVSDLVLKIPKEYNFNINDGNKLLEQIQNNIKFLKRTFLEDSIIF